MKDSPEPSEEIKNEVPNEATAAGTVEMEEDIDEEEKYSEDDFVASSQANSPDAKQLSQQKVPVV